jgi:hypothetical protein
MKTSPMRRASPESRRDRAMSMATMTIHTEGSANPPRASRMGVPLATIAVSPSSTIADAGSGSMIIPTITHRKIAICRQPWGVTADGWGMRKVIAANRMLRVARPRARDMGARF